MAERTEDEVVSVRTGKGSAAARPAQEETVGKAGGAAKIERGGDIEDENHGGGGKKGRVFSASTEKLLEKFEKEGTNAKAPRAPAPHEEGDPDEDEQDGGDGEADGESVDDAGEDAVDDTAGDEGDGEAPAEGEEDGDKPKKPAKPAQPDALTIENERLAQRNRELITEIEEARKTPKAQRTERETALMTAEDTYYNEGSVAALRKFLGVIIGSAPDSKEVDAELSGVYADLTEREVGVPMDQNQRALRDNARTRLLLARDKREKVEAAKKPVADNSADDVKYEEAAKHVHGMLTTKAESATSAIADEHPLLMALAKDFDGFEPSEVVARAIRRDIMAGTLDPTLSDADMIRTVASRIEKHYDSVAKKIEAARNKNKKPGTTTPSVKPKAAVETSTAQRQSPGARTLTNAAASRAPAKPPKTDTQQPTKKTSAEKTRKDFPSESAWRDHLLTKHFPG